jgi:hypothetical protein
MRLARLLLAGIAGTLAALAPAHLTWADAPATQPADLASYSNLVKKCADYDRLSNNWKWSTIYTADFRPGQPHTWRPEPTATDAGGNLNPNAVQTQPMREDGHDELLLNGLACQFAFLDVGPMIRGEVAVDMVCKNIGPRACDLSIIFGGYHLGPGFQFGSYDNTKAVIYTGVGPNDNFNSPAGQPINCTGSPQTFQLNQWYHVRLEVKDGEVRGIVDGHEVGKVPLNPNFPLDQPHQAFLYTYNSQMVVRELHIEAYAHDMHNVDPAAWAKVFGNEDQAEVQKGIDGLVRLLADPDSGTRDKAEQVLNGMGALAIPALQRAEASDVPELSVRADAILQVLNTAGRAPTR